MKSLRMALMVQQIYHHFARSGYFVVLAFGPFSNVIAWSTCYILNRSCGSFGAALDCYFRSCCALLYSNCNVGKEESPVTCLVDTHQGNFFTAINTCRCVSTL